MMVSLQTHICVTRSQWVNVSVIDTWPLPHASLAVSQKASLGSEVYRLAMSMVVCAGFHAVGWNITRAITILCTLSFTNVESIRNYTVSDNIDLHLKSWVIMIQCDNWHCHLLMSHWLDWCYWTVSIEEDSQVQWSGKDFSNGVP